MPNMEHFDDQAIMPNSIVDPIRSVYEPADVTRLGHKRPDKGKRTKDLNMVQKRCPYTLGGCRVAVSDEVNDRREIA